MQAIIISENGEEREFLSYVLRRAGLAVTRTAAVKLVTPSLLKQPVDLILLSAKSHTAVSEDVATIRTLSQAPLLLLHDAMTEDQTCKLPDAGVDLILERPYSPRILARLVAQVDPEAFVTIGVSHEAMGAGFTPMPTNVET